MGLIEQWRQVNLGTTNGNGGYLQWVIFSDAENARSDKYS